MIKEAMKRIASELRYYNPLADKYKGEFIHKVWAAEIEEALAKQEQCEPVMRVRIEKAKSGGLIGHVWWIDDSLVEGMHDLYTTPQQRKPLTDEQIADIVIEMNGNEPPALFWKDLTRAIEAAHGIKETP